MERFLLKKLIVISDKEKSSFETDFEKGLNIIIGENKTGKSSIIKSIFYTLGCETYMESSWKELINTYILMFNYGLKSYCLIRQAKKYKIYETDDMAAKFLLICNADNYSEYTDYLLKKLFKIEVELIDVKGNSSSFIPPLLFRFQYIDQDSGWLKLGESFTNCNYIKDWRNYSIKFITGYQDEEYYKIKKNIEIISNELGVLKLKEKHFSELFDSINKALGTKEINAEEKSLNELKEKADRIINELSSLEREKISINERISELKNYIYENNLELNFLKKSIEHLNKDHSFALEQDEEVKCPVCGTIYNNSISERIEIIKDIQSGEELISSYRRDINNIQNALDNEIKKKHQASKRINEMKIELKKIEETINISEIYKNEGRKDVINVSMSEKKKVVQDISAKETEKSGYEVDVNKLSSKKRMKEIKKNFIDIYEKVLEKVKISSSHIKLTGFIQKLENTGSERPRIILSYHLALYLYNLSRGENVYNWLVVDTPNQQGQDSKNLRNIDSLIEFMTTESGQCIIGTERETGYEDRANKVIRLLQFKRCLRPDTYEEHKRLLSRLDDIRLHSNS